jgi:small subunit ribosomal protein S1
LGHKQTTANPWDQYEDSFAVLELSTGEIAEIVDKGAVEFGMISLLSFLLVTLKEDGREIEKENQLISK